jgi:hypothetical protein
MDRVPPTRNRPHYVSDARAIRSAILKPSFSNAALLQHHDATLGRLLASRSTFRTPFDTWGGLCTFVSLAIRSGPNSSRQRLRTNFLAAETTLIEALVDRGDHSARARDAAKTAIIWWIFAGALCGQERSGHGRCKSLLKSEGERDSVSERGWRGNGHDGTAQPGSGTALL